MKNNCDVNYLSNGGGKIKTKATSLKNYNWDEGPFGEESHISGMKSNVRWVESTFPYVYNSAIISDKEENVNINVPFGFLLGANFKNLQGREDERTLTNTLFDTEGLNPYSFRKLRGDAINYHGDFNYYGGGSSYYESDWDKILPEYIKYEFNSSPDWICNLLIQTENFILEGTSFGPALIETSIKYCGSAYGVMDFRMNSVVYLGSHTSVAKNIYDGKILKLFGYCAANSDYSYHDIAVTKISTGEWGRPQISTTSLNPLIDLTDSDTSKYSVNPFCSEYLLAGTYHWPVYEEWGHNFGNQYGDIPFTNLYFSVSPNQETQSFSEYRKLFIDNKQVDFLTDDSVLFVYKDKILNSIGEVKISDMSKIYGVDQVGRQWPNLANYRTDDAVGMGYTKQEDSQNNIITYQSDFDNAYPWSCIKEVLDKSGNVFIRIPKFYHKYTKNENGTYKVQISGIKHDNSWVTCFVERGIEIPYVDIGKYQASEKTVNKDSRLTSVSNKGLVDFKTVSRTEFEGDYGVHYHSFDVWNLEILRLLFLVEFATTDSNSIIKTVINPDEGFFITGTCDGILTGQKNARIGSSCVYRGIENPWGNGRIFVDGISFKTGESSRNIYISNNSQTYKDNIYNDVDYQLAQNSYLETGSSGFLKEISPYTTQNFRALTVPSAIGANKNEYYCSEIAGSNGILTYGFISASQSSLWTQDIQNKSYFSFLSCRLCHKQDIHIKTVNFVTVPGEAQYITQGLKNQNIVQLKIEEDNFIIPFEKTNGEITFKYENNTNQDKTITLTLFSTYKFYDDISINQVI